MKLGYWGIRNATKIKGSVEKMERVLALAYALQH